MDFKEVSGISTSILSTLTIGKNFQGIIGELENAKYTIEWTALRIGLIYSLAPLVF